VNQACPELTVHHARIAEGRYLYERAPGLQPTSAAITDRSRQGSLGASGPLGGWDGGCREAGKLAPVWASWVRNETDSHNAEALPAGLTSRGRRGPRQSTGTVR
jgi:hypothetical protein